MPIAATTQIVAALVNPTTAPRACKIVPAPIKPTPVTICAATRVVSVPGGMAPPLPLSIARDRCVYSTDPMQMRILVLRPAGLPPSSRSRPIAPPSTVARPTWSMRSKRKISTTRLSISPISVLSSLEKAHAIAHLGDHAARQRARPAGSRAQPLEHAGRFAPQGHGALAHRRERGDHVVGQHPFAVEAAPPRGPALVRHLGDGVGWREALMNGENVADLGRAGVLARFAGGIGGGGPQLLPNRFGRLEQADRVAQTLGHLRLAVEPQDALHLGEQRLRFRKKARAVARVPAARDFPHQLEMLDLILSHRDEASFIEQYVCRL